MQKTQISSKNMLQIALKHVLKSSKNLYVPHQYRRFTSDGKITIDGIVKDLHSPKNPLFVPKKFGKKFKSFIAVTLE